jgi:hypothetical protein
MSDYYQELCTFDSVDPLRLHLDDTSVEIPLQPQYYQPSVTAPRVTTMQSCSPTMLHPIEGPWYIKALVQFQLSTWVYKHVTSCQPNCMFPSHGERYHHHATRNSTNPLQMPR